MIVTTKEAQDLRCPAGERLYNCDANRCMAWRWFTPESGQRESRRGYCGMAGAPHVAADESGQLLPEAAP